jgi:DNA-binding transcriptional LysR family regulator
MILCAAREAKYTQKRADPEYRSASMNTKAPSWDDLRILLAVHRDRSFLAAGKTLGVAASTVARRVEAMERGLGRVLVHRGNDGTRLDPDALRLISLAEELEFGLASLVRDGRDAEVSGTVRVSLSEGFVRPLVPILARLHAKHPALSIELISESRIADLARGEADIGIRIVRSASAAIVSKLLGRASTGLFASREYVERRLPSARLPRDVAGLHAWVGLDVSLARLPQEQWIRQYGASRFTFRSNSAIAIEHAVLAGMGIGLLGAVQGTSLPGLVQLDIEQAPPHVEVFLAFHRDARKMPRIRVVAKEIESEGRRQIR